MEVLGLLARAALVFGLLGLTLYVVRKVDAGRSSGRGGAVVQVLATQRLAKGASLAVVRIGEATYALGVTEHSVQMLTPAELPAPAVVPDADDDGPDGPPSFAAALQAQLGQLVSGRKQAPPAVLAPPAGPAHDDAR